MLLPSEWCKSVDALVIVISECVHGLREKDNFYSSTKVKGELKRRMRDGRSLGKLL
jgi:hypothetical protein